MSLTTSHFRCSVSCREMLGKFGWKAVDLHATILHRLGIDLTWLTFYHNGIQRHLTNVRGNMITELMA